MKPARRTSLISWLALPAFMAIGALELAAPWLNGKQPTWWIVVVCGAAIAWILIVRPWLSRPRTREPDQGQSG